MTISPARRPMRLGATLAACALTGNRAFGSSRSKATSAVNTLVVLAGGRRKFGSLANKISPVMAFISTAERAATSGAGEKNGACCADSGPATTHKTVPSIQRRSRLARNASPENFKNIRLTPLFPLPF
ncbi:MAG: hypothetical protein R3F44_05905 [Candidatus Competibacteraceae bacterium]